MKRVKTKRIVCLIVAIAAVLAMLPLGGISAIVRATTNAPWFLDGLHSFTLPQQERTNFTSKKFNINNPIFADGSVTEFSANNASGWEATTATNAVMGVVNTTAFDTFKGRQNLANLAFMTENPQSSHAGSPNVMVLANKSTTGTASVNFTQKLDEFWADGYFEVKVDFYAVGPGSPGSIYLIPESDFIDGRPMPRIEASQVSILQDWTVWNATTLYKTNDLVEYAGNFYVSIKNQVETDIDTLPTNTNFWRQVPPRTSTLPNHSIWQTATFLVKTDMLEGASFSLALFLGGYGGRASRGVVYYDNIRVTGYSAAQFEQTFEEAKENQRNRRDKYYLTNVVDLSQPHDATVVAGKPFYPTTPPHIMPYSDTKEIVENFENTVANPVKFRQVDNFVTIDNTSIRPSTRISDIPSVLNVKDRTAQVFGNTRPVVDRESNPTKYLENHNVMMMTAVNARTSLRYSERTSTGFNETIQIKRNEIYMINFYALAGAEASTYFRIRDTRIGTLGVPPHIIPTLYDSGFMPIKYETTSSSLSHNNWILNTIFVLGESLADINVNFEFWIGGDDNATTFLMVDDFSITRVSGRYYAKHQDASNVSECIVEWRMPPATIDNAFFNIGTKRSNVSAFPLVATGWEVSIDDEEVTDHFAERRIINGIVNTDPTHWMENNKIIGNTRAYGSAFNPHEIWHQQQSINNNIYMMQNVHATHQTVKSNTFTLTSDTRNVISFDAATHNLSNREVWAVVEIGGREVTRLPLVQPTGSTTILSEWRNYSIAVLAPQFSHPNVRITFALGSAADPTTGTLFIDNVYVHQAVPQGMHEAPPSRHTTVDLNDPSKLFLRKAGANANVGGESLFFVAEDRHSASAFFDPMYDVLNISTRGATHAIIHNTMTEQLEEETAYEYTVRLSPSSNVKFVTYTDHENKDPEYGLSLRIKNLSDDIRMDGGFINLKTEDLANLASFGEIKLTFLIKSGTPLDLSLEIEFGNEEALVVGAVGIKGLELKEITPEAFDARTEDDWTSIITTSTRPPDDGEDGERGPGPSLDFIILPSLITGAAIIFAIVAFTVRRMKFRRHIGKHHTSYARDDFETRVPKKDLKTPIAKKASRKLRSGEDNK